MHTETKAHRSDSSEANDTDGAAPASREVEGLLKESAKQKDLYMRLAADFENYKRRSRQEVETRAAALRESFIVELLPIIDNLERALTACVPRDSLKLHEGVEMTLKQLQQLLRQHGVESDEIVGKPFDPHRHEALSQDSDPAQLDQAILKVLQRGYQRGEKVIRPASVVINNLTVAKQSRNGR